MKSRQFFANLLISILLISPASPLFLTGCSLPFSAQNKEGISPQQLKDILTQITVKVITDNNGTASGTLIKKDGSVYSVVTNHHVVYQSKSFQVVTPDGQVYTAKLPKADPIQDLAILKFSSDNNYPVATVAKKAIQVGENVLAGGFVKDKLKTKKGKIELVLDQPLLTGHQIAYSNKIEQGMSGGAIINNKGELIGINSRTAHPVVPDFTLKDGSKPDQETEKQWVNYSWGLPIVLADKLDPNLALFYCEKVYPQLDIPKQVECIAKRISVRIDSDSGDGSGVIIARNNDSYWVLTAYHVVDDDKVYRVETEDGKTYQVDNTTIQGNEASDIAILQFKSEEDYQVATLANYPLDTGGFINERNETQWVFLYGWQGEKVDHPSVFSAGLMQNESKRNAFAQPKGYELAYTNLAYPGMSGGAVLDTQGRVIGIHNAGGESELLDYSFGMTIARFLGEKFASEIPNLNIEKNEPELVKDNDSLQKYAENLAETAKPNKEEIYATDWLKYATQLWRVDNGEESIEALKNAFALNPDSYQFYYNAGFILLFHSKSYNNNALNAFNQAIILQPTFYRSYLWKGFRLDELKRYDEAIIAYTKAIEEARRQNQGKDTDSFLYALRGDTYYKQEKYPEAITDYTQGIKLNPNDSYAYLNRGVTYSDQGKYPEAIADHTQAIKINPNDADAYNNRGLAYAKQRKYSEAITDFNQAIKLNPNDAYAYNNRGNAHRQQEKYQEAITDYTQAIKLNPNYTDAYNGRGIAYEYQGKYTEAITDYNQAIKLNPNHAKAYSNKEITYRKAMADYTQAIKLNPNDALTYNNRGFVYSDQGKYSEAIADFNQAINLNPNYTDAYNNRGFTYKNQGKYLEAIADFTQAIKLNPNYVEAYFNRGLAYYHQSKYPEAVADFTQAIKLNPNYTDAYNNRGFTYHNQRKYLEAIADYTQAIKLNPNYALAYANRGITYKNQGKQEEAIEDLQKAKQLFQQQGNTQAAQEVQDMLNQL